MEIDLDVTTLDAAKSTIVYGVAEEVSTAEEAVRSTIFNNYSILSAFQALMSFTNQALKNISVTHHILQLEKYQAVTKDDVLDALKTYFLPLFEASSSIAVALTAPTKFDEIEEGLQAMGFEVTQRVMETDPIDTEDL